jgi:ATP adenylyltransferase
MENLWAPWRLAYIKGDDAPAEPQAHPLELLPGGDADCFLCRDVVDRRDRENLVVERTECSVLVLNRFPYNNGHLLIAPQRHVAKLSELSPVEQLDGLQLLSRSIDRLAKLMHPDGFNVGMNLGRVAGAGLPGHLHWHVVPRWNGDTNFMPVLANVKVIPQSLDSLWELLRTL